MRKKSEKCCIYIIISKAKIMKTLAENINKPSSSCQYNKKNQHPSSDTYGYDILIVHYNFYYSSFKQKTFYALLCYLTDRYSLSGGLGANHIRNKM